MDGAWAEYKYLDFNGETSFKLQIFGSGEAGEIELRLNTPDGECIGTVSITDLKDGAQGKFECEVKPVYGRKALYLLFRTKGRMPEICSFHFE